MLCVCASSCVHAGTRERQGQGQRQRQRQTHSAHAIRNACSPHLKTLPEERHSVWAYHRFIAGIDVVDGQERHDCRLQEARGHERSEAYRNEQADCGIHGGMKHVLRRWLMSLRARSDEHENLQPCENKPAPPIHRRCAAVSHLARLAWGSLRGRVGRRAGKNGTSRDHTSWARRSL